MYLKGEAEATERLTLGRGTVRRWAVVSAATIAQWVHRLSVSSLVDSFDLIKGTVTHMINHVS